MAKIKKLSVDYYHFYCPACKHEHTYSVFEDNSGWQFNGDLQNPTFTPSLKNTDFNKDGKEIFRCHLYITNGNIEFCGDCTHELSGQTIELTEHYKA